MSSNRSKSSENRTISQFDRGPVQILNYFSTLNKSEVISIQMLFFVLLEILSLKLTDNDPYKSNILFQLLLHFLQTSKMLPTSMSLSGKSIRQLKHFQDYVRNIEHSIQTALNLIQRPSNQTIITNILEKDYSKILLTKPTSPNINIDIPQMDLQLRVPLSLTMNGTISTNDFDNIVLFRYVQDFYELEKLGKGAFGSVFRARNRLDDRVYAIKKIVFNKNTDQTRLQAKRALREVRVLASLSHANIVQYHCAWLELVPIETHLRQNSSSKTDKVIPIVKQQQHDSLDEIIQFEEGQSISDNQQKSSLQISSISQENDSEMSIVESNNQPIVHESHSDGDYLSISSSSQSKITNRELIPIENSHTTNQLHSINSKIVLFIQMQQCDTTLYDWLRYRDHTITEKTKMNFYILNDFFQSQCSSIFKQLLTAIEYLHSQSFVHRDIKPRNIFLAYDLKDSSSLHVKLGDFGLATLFDSELTPESHELFQNDESTGVGTALYAPPEQLNSNHCLATDKSDSYSLGIVLYELFNVFSTEMERCQCLSDLRMNLKVNQQFAESYPFETNIIERLVSIEREKRPNIEELLTIYTTEIQQRMKKKHNNKKQIIIEQLQEKLRDKDKRIEQLELQLEKNNKL